MSTLKLKIDRIIRSSKVLIRSEIDTDHLEKFKEDLRRGDVFPPVQAVYDGKDYWLYDGNHRVEAELENGNTTILVDIIEGTFRDAALLSLGANADHGVGRSNQDKRNAVTKCLLDEEWGQWSAGMIADICRVSQVFVSKLRKELTQNGFELPSATRGKDGKFRNTENIGKIQSSTNEEQKKQAELEKAKLEKSAQEKAELEELKKAEELKKQEELKKKEIELKKQKEDQDKKEAELKKEVDELKRQKEEQEKQKKLELEKMKKLKQEKAAQEKAALKKAAQKKAEQEKLDELKKKEELVKAAQEKAELEKAAQEMADLKKQVALGATSITSNVKVQADITLLKQQIQGLEGIVVDKDKKIFSLEKQTDDYQSLIAELEIKIDELESENEGLKMVNEELQQEIDQLEPETV